MGKLVAEHLLTPEGVKRAIAQGEMEKTLGLWLHSVTDSWLSEERTLRQVLLAAVPQALDENGRWSDSLRTPAALHWHAFVRHMLRQHEQKPLRQFLSAEGAERLEKATGALSQLLLTRLREYLHSPEGHQSLQTMVRFQLDQLLAQAGKEMDAASPEKQREYLEKVQAFIESMPDEKQDQIKQRLGVEQLTRDVLQKIVVTSGASILFAVIVEVSGPNGTTTQGLQVAQPASPDGRIDGSWNSPGDAPTGAWQIIARGDKSGVVQTLNFTLEGPTVGAGPQMDVSPTLGRPGMRFVISGSGFAPNEDMSIWLNLPDGTIATTTIEGVARSGPTGRIAWTWVAPEDAQPGTWQMVAHGKSSGLEAVGTFTIER